LQAGAGTTHGNVIIIDGAGTTRATISELLYSVLTPQSSFTSSTSFEVTGGTIDLTAGAGSTLDLSVASNGAGAGGAISITAGASSSGATGGDLTLQAGAGGGGAGSIQLKTSSGGSSLTVSDAAVTAATPIVATGGISIGTSTGSMKITNLLSGTCAWSSVVVAAGSIVDQTCTATGAALGNTVILSVNDGAFTTNLLWNAWISSINTITIRVYNLDGAQATVSETFGYTVTAYTTA
jgi:hypothetical protein